MIHTAERFVMTRCDRSGLVEWLTPAGSQPGRFYTVQFSKYWLWSCNCLGFYFRKRCRHVDELKEQLGVGCDLG